MYCILCVTSQFQEYANGRGRPGHIADREVLKIIYDEWLLNKITQENLSLENCTVVKLKNKSVTLIIRTFKKKTFL